MDDRRTVSHVEEPDHPVYARDDLHARIAAAVDKRRTWTGKGSTGQGHDFMLAACDHADDVLARHPRHAGAHPWCGGCGKHDNNGDCPEVRALADLWLGKGRDQR